MLEHGLKMSGSGTALVALEQDAVGAFTGNSFVRRAAPLRASMSSSSSEDDSQQQQQQQQQQAAKGAELSRRRAMSIEDIRSMFKKDIRQQQRKINSPLASAGAVLPESAEEGGLEAGQGKSKSFRSSQSSMKRNVKRHAKRRDDGDAREVPAGREDAYAGSGEDDDGARNRGAAVGRVSSPDQGQGVYETKSLVVERTTVKLEDPSGLAAYTMAGLHSDLAGTQPASQPAAPVSVVQAHSAAEGSVQTSGGGSRSADEAAEAQPSHTHTHTPDASPSSRVQNMVATFTAQARAGEGEARSQGAAVRARCPFGFDLLAAAADDLLQVCLVRLSRVALARCLRAYACPSVGASLPYAYCS